MTIDNRFEAFVARCRGRSLKLDTFFLFCAKKIIFLMLFISIVWILIGGEAMDRTPFLLLFQAAFAVLFAWVVTLFLEYAINRKRPFVDKKIKALGNHFVPTPSFPSGHATISFALATSVTLTFPCIGWIMFIPAVFVAFGRVYVGVHYLSDVVVGALLGAGVSLALFSLLF